MNRLKLPDGASSHNPHFVPMKDTLDTITQPARAFIEVLRKGAEKNFQADGELHSVYFVADYMGEHHTIPMPIPEHGPKREAAFLLQRLLRQKYPLAGFITECWMVHAKKDQKLDLSIPPSEHPDRVEAAMLTVWIEDRTIVFMGSLHRKPDYIEEWTTMNDTLFAKDKEGMVGRAVEGHAKTEKQN